MNISEYDFIKYIDLTDLSAELSDIKLTALCDKCQIRDYKVAALCVQKKYAKFCKEQLSNRVKVASVFNFPYGGQDTSEVLDDISDGLTQGVDEFDIVIPLEKLHEVKDVQKFKDIILTFVSDIRAHVPDNILKFIISTDVLKESLLIKAATEAVIEGKADFVKTCTGQTGSGVTMAALRDIVGVASTYKDKIGIKASGGIKTIEFVIDIHNVVSRGYNLEKLTPSELRIGSSSLLDNILYH